MTRRFCFWAIFTAFSAAGAFAQIPTRDQKAPAQGTEQEPPEEDASLKPKEYSFNPLQAEKEMTIGGYYFRKGSYRAAANRFREATHWNPTLADAFLRLGEAEDKLKDRKAAKEAYAKYLELSPDGKEAALAKKRIAAR